MSFAKCFNLLKLKYCTEYKFSCNSATFFTRHGSCTLQHFLRHYTRNASSPLYVTVGNSTCTRKFNWLEIKSCRHVADSRHRRYFFGREVAREVQEVAHSSLRVRHVQRCCNLTIARKFSSIGLYSFL